jgi:enediyne biosynthesis protein E4
VRQPSVKEFAPEPYDAWAELIYADGAKQKVEFYYGAGYLAQSTRRIPVPLAVRQIVVHDTKGDTRTLDADSL